MANEAITEPYTGTITVDIVCSTNLPYMVCGEALDSVWQRAHCGLCVVVFPVQAYFSILGVLGFVCVNYCVS